MGAGLEIRTDLASPARLRRLARRERNSRTATRMLAIAGALEGRSRAEAARLAGMEPPALTDAEQAMLLDAVFRGPDPARDGCVDWTLPALCGWIEWRFGKRLHPA